MKRRFRRQAKLARIGEAGQAKLEAATARVPSGAAGEIASRYLLAAGFAKVDVGGAPLADARFDDLDPAARDFALGAHAAALKILEVS